MFGSYERSLKVLSGLYNLVDIVSFPSNYECKKAKKKKKKIKKWLLFRSKLDFECKLLL